MAPLRVGDRAAPSIPEGREPTAPRTPTRTPERPLPTADWRAAPLALEGPPKVSVLDLLVGETHFHRGFEPDVAFAIISRESSRAFALTWTPEQLRAGLGKYIDLEPKVIAAVARRMGATTEALESWIAARPWDREKWADKPPRDIAKQRKMLEDCGAVRDARYAPPTGTDLAKEIARSDLSPEQVSVLEHHAKGLVTVEDFLAAHDPTATDGVGADGFAGFVLGLAHTGDHANLRFSTETNLRHWAYGYDRVLLGFPKQNDPMDYRARTTTFMDTITTLDEPIVFLVPPHLNRSRHTRDELLFLLRNPERMKNVTFVFGAYDA